MTLLRTACVGIVAVGLGIAGSALPAHAAAKTNLIADPGFETPAVAAGQLSRFSTGSALGAWTVVGDSGSVDLLGKNFMYAGETFKAKSGSQCLDLTGASQTATGVAQTVTTVVGQRYTLSYFVGNVVGAGGVGTSSTALVSIDGTLVDTATNSAGAGKSKVVWKKFSDSFTASSTHTTVQFINGDPSSDTANPLDAVSLS